MSAQIKVTPDGVLVRMVNRKGAGIIRITAEAFTSECERHINGSLWEEQMNCEHNAPVTLSVGEMRHIVNVMRKAEGKKPEFVKPFHMIRRDKDDE